VRPVHGQDGGGRRSSFRASVASTRLSNGRISHLFADADADWLSGLQDLDRGSDAGLGSRALQASPRHRRGDWLMNRQTEIDDVKLRAESKRYVKQGVDLSLQPLWSMTEKEDELFQWSPLDEKHAVSKWNKQPAIPEVKKSGFTFMS
jgi:hypothetical protein